MEKVHPIEYPIIEKRLLREVCKAIEETEKQYPGVTPNRIMKKYEAVKEFYESQHDDEFLTTTFGNIAPGVG